MAEPVAF